MRTIDQGKKILINYKFDIIGITITSIIYFILDIYYFNFIIDDSFISFRYSEHLATGMGLDWNYGTDISNNQGYTNFLWVIIISIFINFVDPILLSKIISIISGIGIFLILNGINKIFLTGIMKRYSSFFCIILACIPTFAVWTMGGLETIFFSFLMTLGLYYWIKDEKKNKKRINNNIKAQIFFTFTTLTRPEGLIIFSCLMFLEIIRWFVESRKFKDLKNIISKGYIFAILIGLYYTFCFFYYEQLLPNSFYFKFDATLKYGLNYVTNFIIYYKWLFLFFVLDIILRFYYILKDKRLEWRTLYNILIILTSIIAITLIHPSMGESFRFLIFILPLLIISIARVANYLYIVLKYIILILNQILIYFTQFLIKKIKINLKKIFYKTPNFKPQYFSVFILLIIILLGYDYFNEAEMYKEKTDLGYDMLSRCHIPLGNWLYETFPSGPSGLKIAIGDCGAVPYYSKMWTYDLIGLNSKDIIFRGLDINKLFSLNISIFILTSYSIENYTRGPSNQRSVYDSNQLQNNYRLVLICPAIIDYVEKGYAEFVFVSNNITLPESAFDDIPSSWIIKL